MADLRGYETTAFQAGVLEKVAAGGKWVVNKEVQEAADKALSDIHHLRELRDQEWEARVDAEAQRDLARSDRDRAIAGQKKAIAREAVAEQKVDIVNQAGRLVTALLVANIRKLRDVVEENETLKDELYLARLTTQTDMESIDALRDVARSWRERALRTEQDLAALERHAGEVEERLLKTTRDLIGLEERHEQVVAKYARRSRFMAAVRDGINKEFGS